MGNEGQLLQSKQWSFLTAETPPLGFEENLFNFAAVWYHSKKLHLTWVDALASLSVSHIVTAIPFPVLLSVSMRALWNPFARSLIDR